LALAGAIDRECDRFEADWTAGRRPRIEDLLRAAAGLVRPALLRELLASELECRRRRGEAPERAEYLARFPDYAHLVNIAFDEPSSGQKTRHDAPSGLDSEKGSLPEVSGYEILDELGRGGMGVVYLARHRQLDRLVALKMVLAGEFAAPAVLARFRAEARAAARLLHPGIVQLFEVGEQAGRPFVALEYVSGGSLARRLAAAPLPARAAARLVEALARAMEAAHERGIVHRDLKPSNVLLTTDGNPKVTDFGLAKALGADSGLTRSESILGSPSYMAPEQAEGRAKQVGPAADIYSLGTILYEGITGRPPFKSATALETLEQVKTAEPVPPGRLVPGVPRDLETICLTCLLKEPIRRYPTAAALADDLERFLRGEPIRARPVTFAERAWRWARRRPAVAGLVVALALALAGGFSGMTVLWLRAERLRRAADANLAHARAAVDECFSIADRDPILQRPGLQPVRRLLLGVALKYYQGFVRSQGDSRSLRAELARNYTRVGIITAAIGSKTEALAAHRQAQELLERLVAAQPADPSLRRDLGRSHHEVALLEEALVRHAEALSAISKALALRERLAADRPDDARDQNDLAHSLQLKGDLELETGREGEALRSYERAVGLRERLVANPTGDASFTFQHDLAAGLVNLGMAQRALGQMEKALRSLSRATQILEALAAADPESVVCQSSLALAQSNLALVQAGAGRLKLGQRSYGRAVEVLERLVTENPRVTEYRRDLARVHLSAGALHYAANRLTEAQHSFDLAADAAEALVSAHPDVAEFQNDLADIHNNQGALFFARHQPLAALESWERSAALSTRLVAEHPSVVEWQNDLAGTLNNLGIVYRDAGRAEEASRSWGRAAEIRVRLAALHPNVPDYRRGLAEVFGALGGLERRRGRLDEAARSLRLAREAADTITDPRPGDLYTFAYVDAQSAALVGRGRAKLTLAEESERQSLTDRAMATLRRAVKAGFGERKQLEQDVDLDPIRSRADFQALLLDLAFPADPFAR
jgi:tetratricopeptide (TPR) repeat protein